MTLKRSSEAMEPNAGPARLPKVPRQSEGEGSSQPPSPGDDFYFAEPHPAELRASWQRSSQADEPTELELTQADEGPRRELYGSFYNKIVGVRYYNGVATPGEVVLCKREPSNPYDQNAIRINNVFGHQIGHLPRSIAAKLVPFIDKGEITIEAMLAGLKGFYDCPVRLYVFGTQDPIERADLETRLKTARILAAKQIIPARVENETVREELGLKAGGGTSGKPKREQPSVEELARASQAVQVQKAVDYVKSLTAMDEEQLSKLPLVPQPAKLRATLLPYQRQGLAWLLAKETPDVPSGEDAVQLWKLDKEGRYVNMATNFTSKEPPSLLSGGILADDMGLGKTLQVISLIMTGGGGKTLIVAPVSVMSNWDQQIQHHVLDEHLPKVHTYHGSSKATDLKRLNSYDVVITSYGTLAQDREGLLFQTEWRRVVLDEGHAIRNARTKGSEAACLLKAKSRWVLTGTPIINNIRDLHSLIKFLRITGGLEQAEVFNAVLARPLATGQARAEAVLQNLMRDLCLRRKKDMKFIDLKLPPKEVYKHVIEFWPEEKRKYEAMLIEAKGALKAYTGRGNCHVQAQFQSVLEKILRLRQICNHWKLCKERVDEVLKFLEINGTLPLSPENRALLQKALQIVIESQDECPICFDELTVNGVITHCNHTFCRPCIAQAIENQHKCPLCRNELKPEHLVEPAPENASVEVVGDDGSGAKSSKTEALLDIIKATLKKDGSKIVIFSQWTSFLNVVQHELVAEGLRFVRIDGTMPAGRRDDSIRALNTDANVRITLASLAVCSVGLNLVAADTVILADSWWAPAIEDQAIDRVHRFGQTRPITIWRLVMQGSVEERVLDIQAEKRELVTKTFQEKVLKKSKETRIADVRKLLG